VDNYDRLPPSPNQDAGGSPDSERIQRWRWMLEQRVPIIGGWMHRRITSALTESALAGNWLATQSLAVVYVAHQEMDVRRLAGQTLQKINYSTGIDAVWGVWAETRHPGLEKIAISYNRVASQPASIRLLSALKLGQANLVTHGSPELIPALIRAWDDVDPFIAGQALEAMHNLHNQSSIDALCSTWLDNRYPFLGEVVEKAGYVAQKPPAVRVLSALKVNQLNVVKQSTSDMVAPLVTASQYIDPQIAERANLCLLQLQNQAAIDELCRMWSDSRSPILERILVQASYKARSPAKVRLLVALKTGHLSTAEKVDPRGLPHLLDATHDADETIQKNAIITLANLKDEETREAICLRFIENKEDMQAREIALANRYTPRAPEMRALFYFLTGQWQNYDDLDFDQSIMRAIYEASPLEMRQRISTGVQTAGRTDYLTILAGVDYRSRADEVNPNEADLMIRILAENGEHERLWSLVTEFALPFALKIMHILVEKSWRPENEIDRGVFDELAQLIQQPILYDENELNRILQIAIPRANLKVKGRVNEVAFSPTRPVLAIATNQRKVVLWNFQDAVVEKVLEGFQHSVGKVNYTAQGTLIAAERTSTQTECSIYVWDNQEVYRLGNHVGTVTGIEPVGENNLLTTGRDSKAVLWDLVSRKAVKTKEFPFWVRSVAISPEQQYAALLHDRLSLVRLPDLNIIPGYAFLPPRAEGFKAGVAQNAAFSPDGKYVLAGQFNGQVGLYYHTSLTQRPRQVLVAKHSQAVRGIHFLPGHPLVITAGAEGRIRFIRWPEMEQRGTVSMPEEQLTSLRVSHQGSFMATGANDASLVLWDLRVLDIPAMFSRPLATATHDQVANTLALNEYRSSLPESVLNGLKILRILLQYRFRFDIHLEEAPIIRYGEFDIILDEL
jgi:WD40 repeat protein